MADKKRSLVIFANDPGTRNYGYAILRVELTPKKRSSPSAVKRSKGKEPLPFTLKILPLEHGINRYVLDDLRVGRTMSSQLAAYVDWIKGIAEKHRPEIFAAERFMVRRASSGVTTEYVAFMLGTAWSVLLGSSIRAFRFLPAAVWKNAFNRSSKLRPLEEYYAEVEELRARGFGVTPHQLDAFLIGVYAAHKAVRASGFEYLSPTFMTAFRKAAPSLEDTISTKRSRPKKKPKRRKRRAAT